MRFATCLLCALLACARRSFDTYTIEVSHKTLHEGRHNASELQNASEPSSAAMAAHTREMLADRDRVEEPAPRVTPVRGDSPCGSGFDRIQERFTWLHDITLRSSQTLFFIFGDKMADNPEGDHQFMVFITIPGGGSGKYYVQEQTKPKTKHGLMYYFAKGSQCAVPGTTGCVSDFNPSDKNPSNLPTTAGKLLVLGTGWGSQSVTYTASMVGLSFKLVIPPDGNGMVFAEIASTVASPCYVKWVHMCDCQGSGMDFKAKMWYVYADTSPTKVPGGQECGPGLMRAK